MANLRCKRAEILSSITSDKERVAWRTLCASAPSSTISFIRRKQASAERRTFSGTWSYKSNTSRTASHHRIPDDSTNR
ncbi:hypothetical protein AC781_03180 [Akkermansia glycaniphila]|nr:hypothetical protein AC781_03180 [Akkermansia glycaniphila]